ncbi:Uncharacterised protein [Corynebacterium kutscheri]|uniref:Uncharacterized protein n=1 Tax=Corynebacterium kutscheri TaxID=35755 RepID=A0AB38VVU5_9CORY|nr:Uncharacterised protein [Corynebacterium kutscheri]
MFPTVCDPEFPHSRCPRASGDVPPKAFSCWMRCVLSPRERGCSLLFRRSVFFFFSCPRASGDVPLRRPPSRAPRRVVPARAGMFPHEFLLGLIFIGCPRASGDVPYCLSSAVFSRGLSPRERGCSRKENRPYRKTIVVPARAGMFRQETPQETDTGGCPRASGDVPDRVSTRWKHALLSPRERGCSLL